MQVICNFSYNIFLETDILRKLYDQTEVAGSFHIIASLDLMAMG